MVAGITIHLDYHPPLNWEKLYGFFCMRAVPGVESCHGGTYMRTFETRQHPGIIKVRHLPGENALELSIQTMDHKAVPRISQTVKALFDLDAPSREIDDFLLKETDLSRYAKGLNGIRVPGCWDFFELALRAVIGQQISVKGAATLMGRISDRFGRKIKGYKNLSRIFPSARDLCQADLSGIGLTRSRMETIRALTEKVLSGDIDTRPCANPKRLKTSLLKIRGIGEWTAEYILMRTLKYADAFPASDLGLLKAVSLKNTPAEKRELKRMAEAWRPWRSYAALYLWSTL